MTGRVRLTPTGRTGRGPRVPQRWWADLAGSAALLSAVVVVALWVHRPRYVRPASVLITSVPRSSRSEHTGSASRTPAVRATTVNGTVPQTRWGPVQIQAVIVGKKITGVRVLQHPTGNSHDDQINAYALPQLRQQVLRARSARIDGVSGATVTSDGYRAVAAGCTRRGTPAMSGRPATVMS
ncbi:FMN-binding protein [Paractinoplanes brasiliensis]|uniref:FMN-binding protein n=1 Tax=Paractinoplanes brasiliensis TaxID=52695 RepID=UPI001FB835F8|nr:FMN-binding protein [Actinoplanes brasiliensis]